MQPSCFYSQDFELAVSRKTPISKATIARDLCKRDREIREKSYPQAAAIRVCLKSERYLGLHSDVPTSCALSNYTVEIIR